MNWIKILKKSSMLKFDKHGSVIGKHLSLVFFLLGIFLLFTPSCKNGIKFNPIIETYIPIKLGNDPNKVNIGKAFFLGHRVDSFRLKVRLNNPGRTSHWISGLTFKFRDRTDVLNEYNALPADVESDGSFWTDFAHDNRGWIFLTTSDRANFQGGQPKFEILQVERYFKKGTKRTDIPASTSDDHNILSISAGREMIGYNPEVTGAQHFKLSTWGYNLQVGTIYISPYSPEIRNETVTKIYISTTGFKNIEDEDGWIEPKGDDSGIYHQFVIPPRTSHVYITVKSLTTSPYFITYQTLKRSFADVVIERDEDIGIPEGSNNQELRDLTSRNFPYGYQLAGYLSGRPNIEERIKEIIVLTSAQMLNASDGLMRLGQVDVYSDIYWLRNVDVQIKKGSGRASAGWSKISLYEDEELQDALAGSKTFHHEWSHWEYNMPDEYLDVYNSPPDLFSMAICPNSCMGTHSSDEFCHSRNHRYSEEIDSDENSMWDLLVDQYNVLPSYDAGGLNQCQYFDVLNKIETLIDINFK